MNNVFNNDQNQLLNASVTNLVKLMLESDPSLESNQPEEVRQTLCDQLIELIQRDYLDGWAMLRIVELRRKPRTIKKAP